MSDALPVHRPLESALFGQNILSAHVASIADVDAMLAAVQSHKPALVVVRVPADAIGAMQRLEAAGGRVCDILVTLSGRMSGSASVHQPAMQEFAVRRGDASDATALRAIGARAFSEFVGHWHADPRLPRELADELYARWASDLAKASSELRPLYVVATEDGKIVSFLALAESEPQRWHVPLTAVDPAFQGRGLLCTMLLTAMHDLATSDDVALDYETQLTNRAAISTVSRCGLVPSISRLTFHLWTTQQ